MEFAAKFVRIRVFRRKIFQSVRSTTVSFWPAHWIRCSHHCSRRHNWSSQRNFNVDAMICARLLRATTKSSRSSFHLVNIRSFGFQDSLARDADLDTVDHNIRNLLKNNRNWVEKTNARDPTFFERLGKGQSPKYLYFGCSDSRVPANRILGLGPGEVFVHRNIGNQVPGNDLNVLSVLEYAVGHLGVTDIIVTGHYACGAVKAATARQDLGTLENWLRLIRDVYRLHKDALDPIVDEEEKHQKLVQLNVVEQCLNVYKTGVVQRKRQQVIMDLERAGKSAEEIERDVFPRIHGMVFNPADGVLRPLKIDFEKRVGSLKNVYSLYEKGLH